MSTLASGAQVSYRRCMPKPVLRRVSSTLPALAACVLIAGAACDKSRSAVANDSAETAKAPSVAIERAATEPAVLRGEADGLMWKHEFDAGNTTGIARCADQLYSLTAAGRVVQWNRETLKILHIPDDLGAVSTIDAAPDGLLFGTFDGRLISATCDLKTKVEAPEFGHEVAFAQLDPRSIKRALTVFVEQPKDEGDPAQTLASLVDLRTGKSVHSPFRAKLPEMSRPVGFVDYKGELWLGHAGPRGTKLWYLERFDADQPSVQGFEDSMELLGLAQVKRQVWSYGAGGSSKGDGAAFIGRVDSGRLQMMWDGKEAWFGQAPGGEPPVDEPITLLVQSGEQLVVLTPNAAHFTDLELRRWRKLGGLDAQKDVFERPTRALSEGKHLLFGTAHGLVKLGKEGWTRSDAPRHPAFERDGDGGLPVSATWRGDRWEVDDGKLHVTDAVSLESRRAPKIKAPRLVVVDPKDRLWIFSEDRVTVLTEPESRGQSWKLAPMGFFAPAVESTVPSSEDAVGFLLNDGSRFHFRMP